MQNAHLRMGQLEYRRNSGKTDTKISVHVDRYVGQEEDAHLISLFGGDSEVGAITTAIHEKHTFTVMFPDRKEKVVGFDLDAICYRGSINLQGRKQALRHLIAVSTFLHANGSAGRTFILHLGPDTRELAWATLVSFLGLPADPRWSAPILEAMWAEKKFGYWMESDARRLRSTVHATNCWLGLGRHDLWGCCRFRRKMVLYSGPGTR